jgi:hypothetical protein
VVDHSGDLHVESGVDVERREDLADRCLPDPTPIPAAAALITASMSRRSGNASQGRRLAARCNRFLEGADRSCGSTVSRCRPAREVRAPGGQSQAMHRR